MARFKLDENLPVEGAAVLRAAGHDADTVGEEGLGGSDDKDVLARCRMEARTLVTLDLDFADITAYPPSEHEGIVVFRLRRQDRDVVLAKLSQLAALASVEALPGQLWIVEDVRVRIRS